MNRASRLVVASLPFSRNTLWFHRSIPSRSGHFQVAQIISVGHDAQSIDRSADMLWAFRTRRLADCTARLSVVLLESRDGAVNANPALPIYYESSNRGDDVNR